MQGARGAAPPAELTPDLLRECRGAASAVAAELEAREREVAALNARWPKRWPLLLEPGSVGQQRAADAQAAAELRGAQPPCDDGPSKEDGKLLEAECQAQLQESILVWLQSTAARPEDAGGAGPGANPLSLDESGDAPDMPRLKKLAKHSAELVAEMLDELESRRARKRLAIGAAAAADDAGGSPGPEDAQGAG